MFFDYQFKVARILSQLRVILLFKALILPHILVSLPICFLQN